MQIINASQGSPALSSIGEEQNRNKDSHRKTEFGARKVSTASTDSAYSSSREDDGTATPTDSLKTSRTSLNANRRRRSGLSNLDAPTGPQKGSEELLIDSMTWGVDEVEADPKQGLPRKYIKDFIAAVDKRGYPLSCRPVDALCKRPIQEGNPTKPFPVKGKSADWGLQQSFVCVDQHYSKLHGRDEATINKYSNDVARVSSKHAVSSQLKISAARISELEQVNSAHFEKLETSRDSAGNPCHITFKVFANDWTEYTQVAELNPEDDTGISSTYLMAKKSR